MVPHRRWFKRPEGWLRVTQEVLKTDVHCVHIHRDAFPRALLGMLKCYETLGTGMGLGDHGQQQLQSLAPLCPCVMVHEQLSDMSKEGQRDFSQCLH